MAKVQTVAALREVISSHINSITDAFYSLAGERSPDFVLGLTTLDEAFAFSSRCSSRQWVAFLRSHKLVSADGAPRFKIFEHNLARPSDVYQLTSVTAAAAADLLLRACGGGEAASDFDAAHDMAVSRASLNSDVGHQQQHVTVAQVNVSVFGAVPLASSPCFLEQFAAALCALSCRCVRSVTEFGAASACSSQAALLALFQHLQIVDNM
jgi:hypothetical protein